MAKLGRIKFSEGQIQRLVEDIMQTAENTTFGIDSYTKTVLIEGMISDWQGLNGVEVVYE